MHSFFFNKFPILFPLTGLHWKLPLNWIAQFNFSREILVQFQKHFMMWRIILCFHQLGCPLFLRMWVIFLQNNVLRQFIPDKMCNEKCTQLSLDYYPRSITNFLILNESKFSYPWSIPGNNFMIKAEHNSYW